MRNILPEFMFHFSQEINDIIAYKEEFPYEMHLSSIFQETSLWL